MQSGEFRLAGPAATSFCFQWLTEHRIHCGAGVTRFRTITGFTASDLAENPKPFRAASTRPEPPPRRQSTQRALWRLTNKFSFSSSPTPYTLPVNSMKQFLAVALLFLASLSFSQTVPVTGTILDGSGNPISGSFVKFQLFNCGANSPAVASTVY